MTEALATHGHPVEAFFATISTDPIADAFPDARRAHVPARGRPVPPADTAQRWQALLERPRTRPGVAYVHIPFCENHCLFCGFYQNPWRAGEGTPYVDAVITQIRGMQGRAVLEGPPLRALYLGGGTPTALSAGDIARLICALRTGLPLAPDCEITLEGRVWNFTPDKMRAAFDAGVNRISLGVQTFDQKVRRAMGRKASRAEVIARLEALVAADSAAIVIDLIYGLPHQSLATWADDLAITTALGLDGVDLYGLNLIPGTPLLSAVEKGKLAPVTRADLGRFYAAGTDAMDRAGWTAISTSHWRSPSLRERSVYNFEVKTGADCLAFGAGAGGNLGGTAFRLMPGLGDYTKAVETGACPAMGLAAPAPRADLINAIRAGMERGRLDPDTVTRASSQAMTLAAPLLAQWQRAGLITRHHRFHDLTCAGRFWQVQMTRRLLDWLAQELPLMNGEPA